MLPSKKQWKNWSLPSKLTAIGTLVGVLGFASYIFEKGYGVSKTILLNSETGVPVFEGQLFPDNSKFNSFMSGNLHEVVRLKVGLNEEQLDDVIKFSERQRELREEHERKNDIPLTVWGHELNKFTPYDHVVYFRVADNSATQFDDWEGAAYFIDIIENDDFYFKPKPPFINLSGYFKIIGNGKMPETGNLQFFQLKAVNIDTARLISKE